MLSSFFSKLSHAACSAASLSLLCCAFCYLIESLLVTLDNICVMIAMFKLHLNIFSVAACACASADTTCHFNCLRFSLFCSICLNLRMRQYQQWPGASDGSGCSEPQDCGLMREPCLTSMDLSYNLMRLWISLRKDGAIHHKTDAKAREGIGYPHI